MSSLMSESLDLVPLKERRRFPCSLRVAKRAHENDDRLLMLPWLPPVFCRLDNDPLHFTPLHLDSIDHRIALSIEISLDIVVIDPP